MAFLALKARKINFQQSQLKVSQGLASWKVGNSSKTQKYVDFQKADPVAREIQTKSARLNQSIFINPLAKLDVRSKDHCNGLET